MKGGSFLFIFLTTFVIFISSIFANDVNFSLAGRHFDYLSIDAHKFDSGQPYYNLRGSVTMHWSENLFYFLMRVLDNECWSQSPGNLCNYKLLGIMLDPGTWTHHDAGPLRTRPLEQCPERDKYLGACVDCIHEGAVGSGNYWWIPKDKMSQSGIDLYIMSNGDGYSWDGKHGGSNNIYSGLSSCKGHCSGSCSGYSCCYCSSAYEHGGGSRTEGYYCFPGDDQAVYVDETHLYFTWANSPQVLKANGTYETLRDSSHTPPNHSGYTFPGPRQSNGRSCYNYPDPSPCHNVWDGADITKFGFCTGPGSCGDYPADSISFKIHLPDVYAELGIDAGDVVGRGGGYIKWDYFDITAYMRFFFWDNSPNDGVNNPDALDLDIQVTNVDLDGSPSSDFDLNLGLGTIVSILLPLFTSTLEGMFQDILNNSIKNALAGSLPIDMNNILGDPWKIGKGLLDVALYGQNPDVVDSSYSSTTQYHEVNGTYDFHGLWRPSTYTNCAMDIKLNAAVEPILFNADCSRDMDLNNPEPTDFFGICTLYNHGDGVDEDQQFDDDSGPTDFGPPLIDKSDVPPPNVTPPSLSSLSPIQYGINTWGGFRTVMYDANHNGVKDDGSSNIFNYDMALSIHENFLNQALYSAFAAGIVEFEMTPYDENGKETPFKDFLKVDVWKNLIPVLGRLAKDNSYVEIKMVPRDTPMAAVGVGTYNNTSGPGQGMTGKFDVAFYFPALDFEFWFTDKWNVKKRIMTLRWNLTAGFDLEFHKGCSPLDPYYGQPQCNPNYDYLPDYVPGYIMLYGEINSPSLISYGITPVEVVSSEIDVNTSLLKDQFSNLIPVLMSSYVQFYVETRFRLAGLTFDLHYSGPDGPGNKWFSLYITLLGNVNIFQFLGNLSLSGASPVDLHPDTTIIVPGAQGDEVFLPSSYVKNFVAKKDKLVFRYNGSSKLVDPDSLLYTYRLDGGLWHPPVRSKEVALNLKGLLDGKHTLEVASIQSYGGYTWMDYTPAKVEFTVDRTPPVIAFLNPGTVFASDDSIIVGTEDMSDVKISWKIDDGEFSPWTTSRIIPLEGLGKGVHRLIVKAMDEAGNISEKGLVFEIKSEGSGCTTGTPVDYIFILLLVFMWNTFFRLKRREFHKSSQQ